MINYSGRLIIQDAV